MAVTLRDVAKRAGVSAMTVSRVVNGGGGVDPETQRKVEDAILALDYVPNRLARGLISHKSKTIGLIVPDVVNPFFAPVVRGAETTAPGRSRPCNSGPTSGSSGNISEDLIAHRIEDC
jgi:LacI family transcriptional regulator